MTDFRKVTGEALQDRRFNAGVTLMVCALMRKFGLTEFTLDPDQVDWDDLAGMEFKRDGKFLTAKLLGPAGLEEAGKEQDRKLN